MSNVTPLRDPACPVCDDLLRVRWSVDANRLRGTGVASCPACLFTDRPPLPVFHLRPYRDQPKDVA